MYPRMNTIRDVLSKSATKIFLFENFVRNLYIS